MTDNLFKYLKIFASRSDFEFIIEKASKYMFALDEECQEDRMNCTVRPMCDKRRWLSLLIKSGMPEKYIPRFCYELQVKIVHRSLLKEKYFYEPEDCAIYLDDFLPFISQGRHFALVKMLENEEFDGISWKIRTYFRLNFNKVLSLDLGEYLLVYADDLLWFVDYIGNYIIFNVQDERIISQSTLLAFIKLLNRYYKREIKIFENAPELWILDVLLFEIENPDVAQNTSFKSFLAESIGKIAKYTRDVKFKIDGSEAHLLVTINAFCDVPKSIYSVDPVSFGEIINLYRLLNEFQKNMGEWVKKNISVQSKEDKIGMKNA
ncbi:MAG: hypothetical protein ACTSUE_19960 [Promethearchaeota archaeon]